MNKITSFVTVLMLVATATKASEVINFSNSNLNFDARFNNDEPIQFLESGIDFFVFPNGDFDFNTRLNDSQGDYYFKTAGRRNVAANGQGIENYGIRIERDNFGRIRRIGNTFINYDFQDRVSRIGSVFLRYNRFALIQIGGLQLVYNRFGNLINTYGSVKSNRNPGFINNYYSNNCNYNYNNNINSHQYNVEDYNQVENEPYYYKSDGSKSKFDESNDEIKESKNSNK